MTRVREAPDVQTYEAPLDPDSVEQIKSDDTPQMLRHGNQELELTRRYPGQVHLTTLSNK
jgi:hypothetical protein